ncbi:MAG: DUF4259 domain-containing protein [Granulosicoccus sp.]|nr:DUF4259 domain-containing protein [Granulosicoccus sp.]
MRLKYVLYLVLCLIVFFQSPAYSGAWGIGSFENDDALDFIDSFEDNPRVESVVATLKGIANHQGYLQASDGAYAIVAAEILAVMNDHSNANVPDSIVMWSKNQSKPKPEHLQLGLRALSKVCDFELSELAQLWSEDPEMLEKWKLHLAELESWLQ